MIYLAGSIHGLTLTEANDWRERAKETLSPLRVINPLDFEFDGRTHPPAEIIKTDLEAIDDATEVLVDLRAASWGTAMEIMYAHGLGTPVIGWGSDGNISPWVRHHVGRIYFTLHDAVREMHRAHYHGL